MARLKAGLFAVALLLTTLLGWEVAAAIRQLNGNGTPPTAARVAK